MKLHLVFLALCLSVIVLLNPVYADLSSQEGSFAETGTGTTSVQGHHSLPVENDMSNYQSGTSGEIKPVSPKEFGQRINKAIGAAHEAGKPLVNIISKAVIGISAILLLLVLFLGKTVLVRAVGALIAVGVGIILYNNTDKLVGLYLWMSQNL